ncbi:PEP-CTERM sorting domain-containing protein [Duganella sp. sic0402]|uniref:PEP-CTERM sorting domain-containing protein n=1 Tax=Duganella sp. sic0402 TaxID=2854786 RepID=UPI001C45CC57|nr:PEP-CTERM sorting domain-containing protein [Duganella sp. sic0402]MBV7535634.1 PEP-CTERM sorting domain-containing protein [Duganella sp. sic0402]
MATLVLTIAPMASALASGEPPGVPDWGDVWHKITADNADYYYMESIFGATASVQNGALSFDTSDLLSATVSVENPGGYERAHIADGHGYPAIVVIPHAGYGVANALAHSFEATSKLAQNGGSFSFTLSDTLYVPGGSGPAAHAYSYHRAVSEAAPFTLNSYSQNVPMAFHSSASVDVEMTSWLNQLNSGVSSATISSVSYAFFVSEVPEPESWAMMLAGLTAVAGMSRRRARAQGGSK